MKMKVSSISIWCMVMAVIMAAASATLTWKLDTGDSKKYSAFLNSFREELGRGTPKVCNIPVTNKNNNQKIVLVNLVTNKNNIPVTITLAFRASDAYLIGFQDRVVSEKNVKKLRANFFSDMYKELSTKYKSIFGQAVEILGPALPVSSSYKDLESKGTDRGKIALGVSSLENAIIEIYGIDFKAKGKNNGKLVANFALIAIQMITEAARFKDIEGKVIKNGMSGSFKGGDGIKLLENNWKSLSKQFHDPARRCQPRDARFTEKEMKLCLLLDKRETGLNLDDHGRHAALAFI